jgi:hypothetical protein
MLKCLIVPTVVTLFVACSGRERTPQPYAEQPIVTGVGTTAGEGHISYETVVRVPHSRWKTGEGVGDCVEAKCGRVCVSIPIGAHVVSEELFAREGFQFEWRPCSSRDSGKFWDCGVPWARFRNRRVIATAGQRNICYEFRAGSQDWDARLVVTLSQ